MDNLREQGVRIKKIKYAMSFVGKTDDEGLLVVGIASGNLTSGEISETFSIDAQSRFDVPGAERMKRHVFPLMIIHKDGTEMPVQGFNGYKTFRFPWPEVSEGDALQIFAHTSSDNFTTGCTILVSSIIMGEWLDD